MTMQPVMNNAQANSPAPLASLPRLSSLWQKNALLVGTILLMLYFSHASSVFLSVDNLRNVAVQGSIVLMVAVPSAILLIAGYVDLSIGSALAVASVVGGLGANSYGVVPGLVAGVAVGSFVGAVNGWLICIRGFSSIIVTLGMLSLLRGVALVIGPDPIYGFPDAMVSLGSGAVFGVPYLLIIALAIAFVGSLILMALPLGRHVYAIGANARAAFLSGILVPRTGFKLYVFNGAITGVAGVLLAARLNSAPSESIGVGFELSVLTAILLGGVSFSGGRGNIFGVVLGVWFLGTLQNGLTLENVQTAWTSAATGGALVFAAALDWLSRRSEGSTH
jgi:ribose transport system permease protein